MCSGGWQYAWLVVAFGASGCTVTGTPTKTSVCKILKSPAEFDGELVQFRAAVLTDWHHGTLLFHPSCDGGIQLRSDEDVPNQHSMALKKAIGTREESFSLERTAVGTFTGTLRVTPYDKEALFDGPLKFDAQAIEDIRFYHPKPRR